MNNRPGQMLDAVTWALTRRLMWEAARHTPSVRRSLRRARPLLLPRKGTSSAGVARRQRSLAPGEVIGAGGDLVVVTGRELGSLASWVVWVEQIAEHPEHRPLFFRLHECGEVLGRGRDVLYVRFAGEDRLLSVSPALVCLLPEAPGGD